MLILLLIIVLVVLIAFIVVRKIKTGGGKNDIVIDRVAENIMCFGDVKVLCDVTFNPGDVCTAREICDNMYVLTRKSDNVKSKAVPLTYFKPVQPIDKQITVNNKMVYRFFNNNDRAGFSAVHLVNPAIRLISGEESIFRNGEQFYLITINDLDYYVCLYVNFANNTVDEDYDGNNDIELLATYSQACALKRSHRPTELSTSFNYLQVTYIPFNCERDVRGETCDLFELYDKSRLYARLEFHDMQNVICLRSSGFTRVVDFEVNGDVVSLAGHGETSAAMFFSRYKFANDRDRYNIQTLNGLTTYIAISDTLSSTKLFECTNGQISQVTCIPLLFGCPGDLAPIQFVDTELETV